jgi:CDP-diacylglycerol--serine O-phosphatidyltransferase
MAPGGGSRYFVGLPCPAAAGLIVACVHAIKIPIVDWRWSIVWMGVVVGAAALMVSTARFRSFKDIPLARRQPSVLIVPIAVLVPLIFFFSEVTLMLIATSYVAIGLALHVLRVFRHHWVSHPA